jgi:nitrite reductase/ring-hydroxylating ferredoxin subunit
MEWVKVFSSGDEARRRLKENIPQLLIVNSKRLCLVLRNNSFFAVQDSCSHNGESLSKGTINYLGEIVCPWHAHQFNMSTGRECSERSSDLNTYPIREDKEGLFIGM